MSRFSLENPRVVEPVAYPWFFSLRVESVRINLTSMEDITGCWANLSLNAKEVDTVELEDQSADVDNAKILVAKFFTKHKPNIEAITHTLRSMWKACGTFEIRELGDNTVLLLFAYDAEVQQILTQGPWSFDKYLIASYKPYNDTMIDS